MLNNTYTNKNTWDENSKYIFINALRQTDDKPVLIKSLKSAYPIQRDIRQLKNEYALLQKFKHKTILEAIDLAPNDNSLNLILAYPQSIKLNALIGPKTSDAAYFLEIARPLVDAVVYLHSNRVVHKNLNPDNIFFDEKSKSVQLAGFEIAIELGREAYHSNEDEAFETNLAYISPEQTGRMNRVQDQRSDLYSLGIIFYELLAHRTPFITDDSLEMIHCHIAKKHTSLSEIDNKIPKMISAIVDKLLEKNSNKRYQSASGLRYDLEKCKQYLSKQSTISDFELGTKDISNRFQLSDKLYGRTDDLDILYQNYERAKLGQSEVTFVSGPSGMGKSALVKEVKKYIDQNKGFFIQGKFDQIKQNAPLNALFTAFSQLVRQLMTESEQQINNWKFKILEAVGTNGRVLTDVIPEVTLLIGDQPPLPDLPVAESTTRFNLVFNNFIEIFSSNEHPLCIFLDDLQWIDHTTRQWIETAISSNRLKHFFLIGAYRNNEVSPSHPLMMMIDELERNKKTVNSIELTPLNKSDIANLVGDTLHIAPDSCHELSEIIFTKTNGNPFFIRQILLSLFEKEAIYFSDKSQSWLYNISKVKDTTISDNVIELMLDLLHRSSPEALNTLKVASCIGNRFDLKTLSTASDLTIEETTDQLSEAIQLGIVVSKGTSIDKSVNKYAFQHDKIQQAAFSLLSIDEKQQTQLKIGRLILNSQESLDQSDKIYTVVDHLNAAKDIISDQSEINHLIQLNLAASKRALSANAYRPALSYVTQSMDLLHPSSWNQPSEITRDLYLQRAEAEHLCGNNEAAESFFDKAIEHAKTDLDKGNIAIRKVQYFNNLGKFPEAYETGRSAIAPLGIKLPPKFIPPLLIKEVVQYRALRGRRSIKDLIDVKEMTDDRLKMALLLMANVTKSAYQIRPELAVTVAAKIVNLSLRNGNENGSCIGFLVVGTIFHGAILNQKVPGLAFGQLTLDLVEKYKNYEYKAETHFVVGYFAIPWRHPTSEMERYWQIAFNAGIEIGDFFHSSCAACGTVQSYFMRGLKYEETEKAANTYLDFLHKVDYTEGILTIKGIQQAMKNLQGRTRSRLSHSDDNFDETTYEEELKKFGSRHFAHYYYINKMRTLYLWGEYNNAYEIAEISDTYLGDSPGMLHTAEHYYYKGLIAAALHSSAQGIKGKKYKRIVNKANKRFKEYSKGCPDNFIHKSQILQAELARISGKREESQKYYYQALESAKQYGYLHIKALANQLLAKYHLDNAIDRIAGFHLKDAMYDYNALGANAYADYLTEKFSTVSLPMTERSNVDQLLSKNTQSKSSLNLDLATILKSSEAISRQIRLKDLLSEMMKIIIENAGAQRMVLLLKKDNKLIVQAESISETKEVKILSNTPSDQYSNIAKSIINYVNNTNEPVILDDAGISDKFGNDPYIVNEKPKSILCVPLSKLGKTTGVIYLENNLSDKVFTQDRIDLIILLSGQMSISIDNALLYDNLEEKVKERTTELNIEKEKADSLLLNILPKDIALELKANGKTKAKSYKQVTVLFADFKNFTKICEDLNAEELVNEINFFYSAFDKIVSKHQVEKIKTIGDCYMCAGSLPAEHDITPHPVVRAAIEMRDFVVQHSESRRLANKARFQMRIGMHTGPVVAGIVGLNKFAYDIWGDTVNIASRIENNSEVGKINISGTTYELIKDDFACTHRGKIKVKNKGMIDMYFVEE